MKIKGLKKAIGDFKRANAGGQYSPRYGRLMFDKSTGKIWTDEFYSIGHNQWIEYPSDSIERIDNDEYFFYKGISMKTVKEYVITHYDGFAGGQK